MRYRNFRTIAKGITRIDDPGKHGVGWYARVTFQGVTSSKYFADGAHGGTEPAFEKALAWRNKHEKAVGKPRTDRLLPAISSRSRTGIPGVYRTKTSFVVAWTPTPGDTQREFISISRYGVEDAFRRAVELRRRKERLMYGKAVSTIGQGHATHWITPKKKTPPAKKRKARKTSR